MTRAWQTGLGLLLLVVIIGAHLLRPAPDYLRLNCHNEIYDAQAEQPGVEGYYMADHLLLGDSGRIYYRYFTPDGKPLATMMLTGRRLNRDLDVMVLQMDSFQVQLHDHQTPLPAQYHQLKRTIEQNIDRNGLHRVRVEVLARSEADRAIIVRFEPSQLVCSCRYSL